MIMSDAKMVKDFVPHTLALGLTSRMQQDDSSVKPPKSLPSVQSQSYEERLAPDPVRVTVN